MLEDDAASPFWCIVKPSGSGVYVFVERGVVWYVGKTNNLQRRLPHHHALDYGRIRRIIRKDPVCGLYFYPCEDPLMSYLEDFLIWTLQPDGNTVQPPQRRLSDAEHYETGLAAMRELQQLCQRHHTKKAAPAARSSTLQRRRLRPR